ncbi:DUF7149 domain-containing protein [Zunongwangia profunda]|uniref:DUF7149 domain-containing protein n=1 Tax=Zunongwangia profunda TaxID=398743 RepID=UPI001D18EB38|nr:N-6 DNA methylase [Zunongwangia profunda]MCC4229642.1 Eco57I restriction-modification methylase domain-containing protein [Zunongwangia profunda]
MELKILKPRKSINKAFLKIKPNRKEIESFKTNLIELLDRTNDTESEEFHKNLVSDFLKNTYYKNNHFINTKGRNDLVIHNGNKAKSPVGVIIEAKKPTNKAEMLTKEKINVKAFQELFLYYLRERITHKNLEIKYLVATNINEWFIFDSNVFEKHFAQNKGLVKQFNDFENGRLVGKTTDFFYKEIAEPFINGIKSDIEFTFFDIREYEKPLRNNNPKDDNKLISLFKLLSPEHLLKLPFANDSNSLDKRFYGELLHIIGLSETKDGSKKLIERNKKGERNTGSFLENAIIQLDSLDKINRLDNPSHFGTNQEERLFNVGLELSITWINRILFLKLLEAQLKTYHKGDKSYEFLSIDKIKNYDDLNSLFFQVLAKQQSERNQDVMELFAKVPYLNSSLFEPTGIEHGTLFISNLRDDKTIPIYSSTVLKNESGKKRTGNLNALEYLFEFLNAYDFSSEGKEVIQEDNKTLINASVLGLIFEKINGYKDGSFFTPGFITMYMCRETIRKAVIQKFNETKDWNCKDIDSLYDKIEDRQEANNIINSLKICDPAVGSGHFLVSALNEMIAIKNDLKVLQDRDGKRLKEYQFEVVNDELIVTDEDGELFEYNPTNKESQRIQEALFHEKQTIIENCLFGVDINPNSVKICRLRLWIELLKNAYYKNESELETLPNIDINIKCGNSLISRFELDSDLKKALKNSKWTIASYRTAVDTYRNAQNKEQKREMETLIADIKSDFRKDIDTPFRKQLGGARANLSKVETKINTLKQWGDKIPKDLAKLQKSRKKRYEKLKAEKQEIENNKIYEEAFEWRFEFPEVLDDDGDYVGFDAIIGNPPYVYRNAEIANQKDYYRANYFNTSGNFDLYKFFIELGIRLNKENGFSSLITNSSFLLQTSFERTREFLVNNSAIETLIPLGGNVFDEATVDSAIYTVKKSDEQVQTKIVVPSQPIEINETEPYYINSERFKANEFLVFDYLLNDKEYEIVNRLITDFPKIETVFEFGVGINTGYIKSELTSDSRVDGRYHPMVPGTGVSKYGNVKTDGYIMYDKDFVKSKGKLGRTLPDEKFFTEPKILVVRTRNISIKERIVATIDYDKKYNLNRISNIIASPEASLEGLLGILNSKLFNWLYSKRYFDYEIKPIYLRNSPLADTNNVDLSNKVKELLSLKDEPDNSTKLELIKEIDKIVFELYGITEDEIKIIKEANA